jgi:hypothetical protein
VQKKSRVTMRDRRCWNWTKMNKKENSTKNILRKYQMCVGRRKRISRDVKSPGM